MYNRNNSGQYIKEQIYQNPLKNQDFLPKTIKTPRVAIPRPIKQKKNDSFSKTTNYQIQNNYFIKTIPNQSLNNIPFKNKINNIYKTEIENNQDKFINESFPVSQSDRYRVILYRKKFSSGKIYSNNSVHFIKHYSNHNINDQHLRTINNERDYSNHAFKLSRDNTPKNRPIINQKRILKPNNSNKMLYYEAYENEFNDNKKEKENNFFTENSLRNNNRTLDNYKITNIKHKSNKDCSNIMTPNNTSIHTIVYTNRKDETFTPKNLFLNNEVKNKKRLFQIERNIQKEINDYFIKNKISYSERGKYINSALLIQTTFRNLRKNGKIKFNFIKKYVKLYRAINSIQALFKKDRYFQIFKDKIKSYEIQKNNKYNKKNLLKSIPKVKSKHMDDNLKNVKFLENFDKIDKSQALLMRSQSRDIINVEKLLKEKEDLEKRLNQIMEENSMLKKINQSNKELLFKNLELTEKLDKNEKRTKKLEMENEQYLSEVSKSKDKFSKIENEVSDVNMKLRSTYLKFIIEKKDINRQKILTKYFKRYKDVCQRMKSLEER